MSAKIKFYIRRGKISEDAIRSDPTTDKSISVSEKNESSDNADNIALTPNEANVLFDEDVSSEPRASASTVPMSGKCGDNVKWKLEPNGNNYKLIISGKGYMDCGENMHQRPWSDDVLRTYANGKVVTSLEVKKGVKSVCGFGSCRSLKHVTLPEGLEEIGEWAFAYLRNLHTITIPKSVKKINNCAFLESLGLQKVFLPDNLSIIGERAFCCTSLKSLSIPKNVKEIHIGAFAECLNLSKLEISEDINNLKIYEGAFYRCQEIRTLLLPEGVKEIDACSFFRCIRLQELYIPKKIGIGPGAFDGCFKLNDIYYDGSKNDWLSISRYIKDFTEGEYFNIGIFSGDYFDYQAYQREEGTTIYPDWANGSNGDRKGRAKIHYAENGSGWGSALFRKPSEKYNNRLAHVAADMSEKSEDGEDAIKELYHSYNLYACEYNNFKNSAAFAIGQDTIPINGVDTTILVITARGTKNPSEGLGDLFKGPWWEKKKDFLDTQVWQNVHEFEEKIWNGINDYVNQYPGIKSKEHLKILITGHSLGGAAANMVGARFTYGIKDKSNWWAGKVTMDDIYVYTYGTIKVLTDEINFSDGYENIHNIYNYYDSYGPNGVQKNYGVSSFNAKFGHTHLYRLEYDEGAIITPFITCENHQMSNYKEALERSLVAECITNSPAIIKVGNIKITGSSKKIVAGTKTTLKAAVSPSNATNKTVAWKSRNTKYATVSSKGVVTVKKAAGGKTIIITATAKDGSGKRASYKLQCMKGIVRKVTISGKKTRTIKAGESVKLKAIVKADKGADRTLKWLSSDTRYATVDSNGKITAKKAGKGKTVKITAASTDGGGKKAMVKIVIE